ncbi:hypothetical protein [Nocardiopsis lucentensis]|uniref:hypothetical protein n=1 Tax=Nocardiopsis lucentensis TaxID=53441 RepID=UPI00034BA814|nr:hypothetical protein [Nocardiopsis lucentensis]
MSAPSRTRPGSDSASPLDPGDWWAIGLFATVYPLLAGTLLWILAFFALMGLLYHDSTFTSVFFMAVFAVVGAGYGLALRFLRNVRVGRPWEVPTVLSAAMILAVGVVVLQVFVDIDGFWPPPLLCLGLCVVGAVVWGATRHRLRFVAALAAVVAGALALAGLTWLTVEENKAREREEILDDLAGISYPVAVLDSLGWEPSHVQVFPETQEGTAITYTPADPSDELDGFSLRLRTERLRPKSQTGWTPLYEGCGLEGGRDECEEHGDVVLADLTPDAEEDEERIVQARTEFADGFTAHLTTDIPKDTQGEPAMELPDIDMVELAGSIRPARPGEAEEIVAAVKN